MAAISSISLSVNKKSNRDKLFINRSLCTDLGITAMPFWSRYRKAICDVDLPCFEAMLFNIGSSKISMRPSVKDPQDCILVPFFCKMLCRFNLIDCGDYSAVLDEVRICFFMKI